MPTRVSSASSVPHARRCAPRGRRCSAACTHRLLVGVAEPAALRERLVEHALELRRGPRRRDPAPARRRSGSVSASTAASISASRVRAVGHGRHHRQRGRCRSPPSPTAPAAAASSAPPSSRPILAGLPLPADPRVLVGPSTADDAGVVPPARRPRARPDGRLLHADRRRPLRLRPHRGDQRAVRRLRDGRRRRSRALNLVAFSLEELGADVLREILRGGADAAAAAGAAIVGGHSIDDPEPKYGLAVTGDRRIPTRVLTNAGGRAGRRARADQAARRGRDRDRRSSAGSPARRRGARRSRS